MITRFVSLVLFGAYLVHVMVFDFVNDDAFISFRYAQNLADSGELVYNLGERVEGYTNFLWTLLLAGVIRLGLDVVTWSKWLGVAFGAATIAMSAYALRNEDGFGKRSLLVAILLIGAPAFACWSTGGLETMMFTFFLTLGWIQLSRTESGQAALVSSALLAVSALVRPEGILAFGLGMMLLTGRWLIGKRDRKGFWSVLGSAVPFVVIYGPYFLWRYKYYGWLFPNTYYVKTGAIGLWAPGFAYVTDWILTHGLYLLPLAYFVKLDASSRVDRWLKVCSLTFIGAFVVHVAKVGGDFMALHRFLVPIMPITAMVLARALDSTWNSPQADRVSVPLKFVLCIILFVGAFSHVRQTGADAMTVGSRNGVDSIGWLKMFAKQCQAAGIWLKDHAPANTRIATTAAGTIPFFSQLYTVDILGLNDEWIAHNVPPRGNRPGHTRSAPPSYLAEKDVDYLIYHPQYLETQRRAGPRTLRDSAGHTLTYDWEIQRVHNLSPPYWGFWKKRP